MPNQGTGELRAERLLRGESPPKTASAVGPAAIEAMPRSAASGSKSARVIVPYRGAEPAGPGASWRCRPARSDRCRCVPSRPSADRRSRCRAVLPCRSRTSQPAHSIASVLLPVAVRTTCPSTFRLMQVSSGMIASADQEIQVIAVDREWRARSSLPCGPSLPVQVLTSPLP